MLQVCVNRPSQRYFIGIGFVVNVSAQLNQRLDNFYISGASRMVQRRIAFLVSCVDVRSQLNQRPNRLRVPRAGC